MTPTGLAVTQATQAGRRVGGRGRWAPLLWNDDAQVTDLIVRKRKGAEPGPRMAVSEGLVEAPSVGALLQVVQDLRARVRDLEAALFVAAG